MAEIQITDEGNIIEIVQGRDLTVVMPVESGIEIEKLRFIQLADTPSSYENAAGKTVIVNENGDGLEFSKTYSSFLALTDTPNNYDNAANRLVVVNSAGTGLRFINYTSGDLNIEYFTQLADVPNNYTGKANYLVAVSSNEDGLVFTEQANILPDQNHVTPGSYKYPQIVINKKGVITNVQEGKPFEFEDFEEGKLLIGDGTDIPAQLEKGQLGQVLQTVNEQELVPEWTYLDSLYDSDGHPLLVMASQGSSNTGTVFITNSSDRIWLRPGNSQTLVLGNGNNITLSGATTVTAAFVANSTAVFSEDVAFRKRILGESEINTTKTIYARDGISTDGTVEAAGDISSSGNLIANRNLIVRNNVQVDGQTILNSGLSVTGLISGSEGLTISSGTTSLGGNTTIDGNLSVAGIATFSSDINLTGDLISNAGLNINPGSGKVTITEVESEEYASRIVDDNDLVTKKYYEDHLPVARAYYTKTNSYLISNSAIQIPLAKNSTIMEINFEVTSNFNSEAKLQITDTDDFVLFDPSDSPYLDSEELKVFADKRVTADNYNINIQILDYDYGEGSVFVTYFEGID